ncbi:MAG: T9SS type A sorting domain-containing protein, partial [Crocinitomicaceae bacterium]
KLMPRNNDDIMNLSENGVAIDLDSTDYQYPTAIVEVNGKTVETNVYPNPASDQITIEFGENNETTFSIRNSIGKEVPTNIQYTNGKAVVNLDGFAPGLYFVIVERDGVLQQEKFIVKGMN